MPRATAEENREPERPEQRARLAEEEPEARDGELAAERGRDGSVTEASARERDEDVLERRVARREALERAARPRAGGR